MPILFRDFPVPIFMPEEKALWLAGGDVKNAKFCTVKDFVNDKEGFLIGYQIIPKDGVLTFVALDELTTIPKKPSPSG